MATEKKQSFFGGAAVLAVGVVIVKIIGALFKIPLANILGETGNADFNNAYNIYAVLLTISTAGLPVALSKMISEAKTLGRENQARRVLKISFAAFLTLGTISFIVMWFGNEWCAELLNNPNAAYGIKALAPGVVCVGCLAAFRGFAQGSFRMTPTAVSQIIEAVCKLFIGLGLSMYVVSLGYQDYIAAAAAIVGVTVGSVLALFYMLIDYLRHRPRVLSHDRPDPSGAILKRLLSIAVPITLSSSMVSVITLIDTSLVQGQLQNALGYSLEEMRHLYGTYSSGMNLYNLPSSMMTALTISVIPTVSASLARGDRVHTARVVNSSLRVTGLIAFPMGFGLWALAEPIMKLCYPRYDSVLGGSLLAVLGLASIFVCLMLISNSILQSYGRVHVPVFTMLAGGVVKIVLNYNLTAVPSINIHAAPFGTLVCFVIVAVLDLFFVRCTMEDKPHYLRIFTKPLIASVVMAICAKLSFRFFASHIALASATLTQAANVALTVALAVVVYALLVLALRIVTRDDLALLPKGDKLARILHVR